MAEQQPPWLLYLKERWMFLLFPALIVLSILGGIIQHWKPPALQHITIEPAQVHLVVGKETHLKATGERVNGKHATDLPIVWTVEGPQGKIAADGTVTALEPGETHITASAEHVVGTATLIVQEEPVAALMATITPEAAPVGQQVTLAVDLRGASGRQLKNLEVRFQPTTANTTVVAPSATTDQQGRATVVVTLAPKTGENLIAIQAGEQKATATVRGLPGAPAHVEAQSVATTALPAGTAASVQVVVHDAHGNAVPGATVRFIGQNDGPTATPSEAVTDATGRASTMVQTRPAVGVNLLDVQVAELPRPQVSLTTQAGAAARLQIKMDPASPTVGAESTAQVQVQDAHGNAVAGTKVEVMLKRDQVQQKSSAVSDATGIARTKFSLGVAPGEHTVEATAPGVEAQRQVFTVRPPAALLILPSPATVEMLGTRTLQAFAADDKGNKLIEVPATWQVKGTLGTITPAGVLTAQALGEGRVTATYQGVSAEAKVSVVPGTVTTLQMTPSEMTVSSGKTQQFRARAFNAQKYGFEVNPTWQVTGPVGTIDAAGLFVATKVGNGEVIATVEGKTMQGRVTVTPGPLASMRVQPERVQIQAGTELQLQAVGYDAAGNPVEFTPTWSLSGELGEFAPGGVLRAQRVGIGEILAVAGTPPVRATAALEVVPAPLQRLDITPKAATLKAGDTQLFTVTGLDAFGNARQIQPTWRLSAAIGTIDATGTLTATYLGQAQLEASAEGLKVQASLTVQAAELATIRVEPAGPLSLQAGQKISLKATGQDSYGNPALLTPTWHQSAQLGTLSQTGELQAERAGIGNVVVSSGSKQTAIAVTVLPGPLARFLVPTVAVTMQAGERRRFDARGVDIHGNVVPGQPTWRVTNNLGVLTADGELSATQVGKGEIIIAQGDVTQRIAVTVQPGVVHTLQVSPETLTITAGGSIELVATGYDVHGNQVEVKPVWQVPDPLASVTPQGKLTAYKAGKGQVVVTAEQIQASVPLNIIPGALATITVEPGAFTLRSGAQQAFKATGRDATGNEVAITPIWSLQGDIGKIDAQGVLHATTPGQGTVNATAGAVQGRATGKVETAQ